MRKISSGENDLFPKEFVAKHQPSHRLDQDIFRGNSDIEWLQVKHHETTWLQGKERKRVAAPHQKIVVNTMEDDENLLHRTPEEEFERYQELEDMIQVAFPGDRWTYGDEMTRREVLREIERSVEGQKAVKRMADEVDLQVALYPIIPGWEPYHFERCHELFSVFDTRSCAFDGTQYNSQPRLIRHLEDLVEVLDPYRVYLNGRISESCLMDVPDEVVTFSGKKSLLEEIEKPNGEYSQELLKESIERRIQALHSRQTALSEFWAQIIQET